MSQIENKWCVREKVLYVDKNKTQCLFEGLRVIAASNYILILSL